MIFGFLLLMMLSFWDGPLLFTFSIAAYFHTNGDLVVPWFNTTHPYYTIDVCQCVHCNDYHVTLDNRKRGETGLKMPTTSPPEPAEQLLPDHSQLKPGTLLPAYNCQQIYNYLYQSITIEVSVMTQSCNNSKWIHSSSKETQLFWIHFSWSPCFKVINPVS